MFGLNLDPNLTNQQVFKNTDWQQWHKPYGISMIYIFGFGGGGSGAGGFSNTISTQRGGSGGGGSASLTKIIIPAAFVPDVLYVQCGAGGASPAANTIGNIGTNSIVSVQTNSTTANVLFRAEGGNPGGIGTAAAGGAAGLLVAATTIANIPLSNSGIRDTVAGIAGTAGGASAGGNAVTLTQATIVNGGTGGGGTTSGNVDGNGGAFNANGILPQILGGSGAVGGTDGRLYHQPGQYFLYSIGGTGSGAVGAGTAQNGGNGGPGSGGGGGGAGVTGGRGGAGGNGMIFFYCW